MRIYVVQHRDSPAGIASREDMAGCPKCAKDLVRANPHKESVTHPNGFETFRELRVGEEIRLPEKWFEPRFELLPPAYFASLPYADGVTPSPFGPMAPVILEHFYALDVAADKLRALEDLDDQAFANCVSDVVCCINNAVQPAFATDYAQATLAGTRRATHAKVRVDVQNALASALSNAQYALRDLYATVQPPEHP